MSDKLTVADFEPPFKDVLLIAGSFGNGENKKIELVVDIAPYDPPAFSYHVTNHKIVVAEVDTLFEAITIYNDIK